MFNKFFLFLNGLISLLVIGGAFLLTSNLLASLALGVSSSLLLAFISLVLQVKGYQELYDNDLENWKKKLDEITKKYESELKKNQTDKKKNFLFIECALCHKINKVPVPSISELSSLTFECTSCKGKNRIFTYFQSAAITEPVQESNVFKELEKKLYESSSPLVEIYSSRTSPVSSDLSHSHENQNQK